LNCAFRSQASNNPVLPLNGSPHLQFSLDGDDVSSIWPQIQPSVLFVLLLHLHFHPSEVSVCIYLYMNSHQDLSVSNTGKKSCSCVFHVKLNCCEIPAFKTLAATASPGMGSSGGCCAETTHSCPQPAGCSSCCWTCCPNGCCSLNQLAAPSVSY